MFRLFLLTNLYKSKLPGLTGGWNFFTCRLSHTPSFINFFYYSSPWSHIHYIIDCFSFLQQEFSTSKLILKLILHSCLILSILTFISSFGNELNSGRGSLSSLYIESLRIVFLSERLPCGVLKQPRHSGFAYLNCWVGSQTYFRRWQRNLRAESGRYRFTGSFGYNWEDSGIKRWAKSFEAMHTRCPKLLLTDFAYIFITHANFILEDGKKLE